MFPPSPPQWRGRGDNIPAGALRALTTFPGISVDLPIAASPEERLWLNQHPRYVSLRTILRATQTSYCRSLERYSPIERNNREGPRAAQDEATPGKRSSPLSKPTTALTTNPQVRRPLADIRILGPCPLTVPPLPNRPTYVRALKNVVPSSVPVRTYVLEFSATGVGADSNETRNGIPSRTDRGPAQPKLPPDKFAHDTAICIFSRLADVFFAASRARPR